MYSDDTCCADLGLQHLFMVLDSYSLLYSGEIFMAMEKKTCYRERILMCLIATYSVSHSPRSPDPAIILVSINPSRKYLKL